MYKFYPDNPLVEPIYILTYSSKFLLLEKRKNFGIDDWEIIFILELNNEI